MKQAEGEQQSSSAGAIQKRRKKTPATPFDILTKSVRDFLIARPPACDPSTLLSTIPKRWSIYPPLALLPQSSFSSPEWKEYLDLFDDARNLFYSQITLSLKATHLALNSPIQSSDIRSPCITPLYGDFGPVVNGIPAQTDLHNAFWVTAIQNGIKQTWAPTYTMFSRGNITEKSRILKFPDVKGYEIADLYVGIGYFAFSYLKAGAKRVWGWDLNPWSMEGLRRGAEMNKWTCIVNPENVGDERIVVYNENNLKAVERLRRSNIRVKHVNLGLLPSSQGSWKIAAEILDENGGWIHVHGNCHDTEIKEWRDAVVEEFNRLFGECWTVEIKEQFRVKEFGPGVGHWVLDLACNKY